MHIFLIETWIVLLDVAKTGFSNKIQNTQFRHYMVPAKNTSIEQNAQISTISQRSSQQGTCLQ